MIGIEWKKAARDQWVCLVPPNARFTLKVSAMADGRWAWEVFSGDTESPMAAGIVGSAGAAKNASSLFLKRAGYL